MTALGPAWRRTSARLGAAAADNGQTCRRCGVCRHVCGLLLRPKPHNDAKVLEE